MVISNLILGGLTGAISNVIGCVRNILCYKDKLNNIAKSILIVLAIIFSFGFINLGLLGFLPLISTVVYIILMDMKDVVKFKYLMIFTMILWFVYDLYIKSYTSACFDFMTIVVSIVSIIQIKRKIIVNMQVIIGNIVALIASIIMVYTGYIKSKNKIIFVQTI